MKKSLHTTLVAIGLAALLPGQLGCSSPRGSHKAEGNHEQNENDEEGEEDRKSVV